jgi:glc operon protein GlcG
MRTEALVWTGGNSGVIKLPGAIPTEGGVPHGAYGKIIGAIGVSGGTSQQDGTGARSGRRLPGEAPDSVGLRFK